jgi:hypothetical protein
MASPIANGRMINRDISNSDKFASLSPEAAVLFAMLIPWFNAHGKLNGGTGYIKDEVCPKISYLTYENIPGYLKEITEKTNVKWFKKDGRCWIHSLSFNSEHQRLDKKGVDKLPSYSPEPVGDCSNTSQNKVPPEIEVEYELEKEAEAEKHRPVDNSKTPSAEQMSSEPTPAHGSFLKTDEQEDLETDFSRFDPKPQNDYSAEARNTLSEIRTKYWTPKIEQALVLFYQSYSRGKHPGAIAHTLKRFKEYLDNQDKEPIIAPFKLLERIVTEESMNFNARDSESICNQFKQPGMVSMSDIFSGIMSFHAGKTA